MSSLSPPVRRPLPLYENIRAQLRRRILSGQLAAGERLATERELAVQFGVSVLTVRQAQEGLIHEGLIAKQQGRGTFVTAAAAGQRRILLVCGLVQEQGAHPSPFFQHSIRYCHEAATRAGLAMTTVWRENHPPLPEGPETELARLDQHGGFIFLGCNERHQTLLAARAHDLPHVNLGKAQPGPSAVWFDPREAARLGYQVLTSELGQAPPRIIAVATEGTAPGLQALLAAASDGPAIQPLLIPPCQGAWEYERAAYLMVRRLPPADLQTAAFLFLDDIVARGGTRALLEAAPGGPPPRAGTARVAVVCGRQELFPYGLPVHCVVHDTAREAQWAVEMLRARLAGQAELASRQSHYQIMPAAQVAAANLDPWPLPKAAEVAV